MASYIIEGGKKIEGEVTISGSKNASLPIIAASILNGTKTILYDVPNIHDIKVTLEILKYLGCKIKKGKNKVEINSIYISKEEIPEDLMKEMRSSVIIAGALLGRFKKVTFSYPGGCDIGARPIDLHLKAFKKLGINIKEEGGFITCSCDRIKGTNIDLDFPSVGATENIILAAVLAEGETIINNAAREPEIVDLIKFLRKMGANISGEGTNIITIKGVEKLKQTKYRIMPDRIETGTFLCAAAITGGKIRVKNTIPEHIVSVISKLEEMGCKIKIENNDILLSAPKRLKAIDINTMPYPGFPTDMQSIFGAVLSTASGTCVITENIFENRFKYLGEIKKMGAKNKQEKNIAILHGVRKVFSANVRSTDLRGGVALVLVALKAKGISKVENIEYILRGYENFDKKLNKLGANVQIKEGE